MTTKILSDNIQINSNIELQRRKDGDKVKQDIRDNLKLVIKDRGYIQAAIAKKARLTPMQLSQILSKERKLEANELFDVCDAIEMTPVELKNYTQDKMTQKGI